MTGNEETVLFAYDGSEFAAEAIREAGRRLRPGPALVLTVWQGVESIAFGPVGMSGEDVTRTDSEIAESAEKTAAEGAEIAREAGFDPRPVAVASAGGVWSTITATAEHHDVALIVLGSHGRAGVSYLLKGSIATAVSQHAKRPVMIIPAGAEDGSTG